MRDVHKLGHFDQPVLICGGAYGNLEALEALLSRAQQLQIPPQRIIHTGDAVAYCADGAAVAGRLRSSGIHCLKGNVEQQLALDATDCGCGFDDGTACDALSASWYGHARATLTEPLRRWMEQLPEFLQFSLQGRSLLAVHGGVSQINRFVFASSAEAVFDQEIAASGCDGVVAGHCGLPFTRLLGDRIWHNSGALGMPANDGTARVWYSLLSPVEAGILITHHPLDYPHEPAADKMSRAKLAPAYAKALVSGLWPGVEVLPPTERQRAGLALNPEQLLWRRGGGVHIVKESERSHV